MKMLGNRIIFSLVVFFMISVSCMEPLSTPVDAIGSNEPRKSTDDLLREAHNAWEEREKLYRTLGKGKLDTVRQMLENNEELRKSILFDPRDFLASLGNYWWEEQSRLPKSLQTYLPFLEEIIVWGQPSVYFKDGLKIFARDLIKSGENAHKQSIYVVPLLAIIKKHHPEMVAVDPASFESHYARPAPERRRSSRKNSVRRRLPAQLSSSPQVLSTAQTSQGVVDNGQAHTVNAPTVRQPVSANNGNQRLVNGESRKKKIVSVMCILIIAGLLGYRTIIKKSASAHS